MSGPLPQADKRRRNAPTIPTSVLPASGRTADAPGVPVGYEFGREASAWWAWAWKTPQAAAWNDGDAYVVARRATLEDDLAALIRVEGLDLFEAADAETARELQSLVSRIASLATGRVALMRECRELDDRLGLTPKGMRALRLSIADDGKAPTGKPAKDSGPGAARYGHLSSVG